MKVRFCSYLAVVALAAGLAANAYALLWDLESLALGAATSVSQTNGGVTMTITRPGSSFSIDDLSGFTGVPASWLTHTLSPFSVSTAAIPFVANFSTLVRNVSTAYGDAQPSDLDSLTIMAFSGLNGTGVLLGTITSATCCDVGTLFEAHVLTLAATGIGSIVFIGGSATFPNSLYYDKFRADLVPEPATLALLGIALVGFAATRRRKA